MELVGNLLLSRFSIFFSIFFLISLLSINAQSQAGFYDEYDMDLRNLPPGPGEDRFPLYPVPPKKKNNFAVTPRSVRRYYDPLAGFPGAGTGDVSQLGNQGSGRVQAALQPSTTNFINPITGEINYDAVQASLQQENRERERKEKDMQRFQREETYKESKLRRFQIVFFLTTPFALAASAGVAGIMGIERTITGSILMITGTVGLSGANAYQDLQKMDEHKKVEGTEWHEDTDEEEF